uniref:Prospero domain-containing protein n=1 Tax=Knipowitschia caucasica TaxID=637954 RepID=A0AAV2KFV7_KNICA
MIPNSWSKDLYCSNLCLEGCVAKASPFHPSPKVDAPDLYLGEKEAVSRLIHFPVRRLRRKSKGARADAIVKDSEANAQEILPEGTNTSTTLQPSPYQLEMFRLQNQYQHWEQVQVKEASNRRSPALSSSVDTIFKTEQEPRLYHPYFSPYAGVTYPTFQTDAISLVVHKDRSVPISPYSSDANDLNQGTKMSAKSQQKSDVENWQQQMVDKSWYVLKQKSKLDAVNHTKSLPISRVRHLGASGGVYSLNEGLTTNHLKKAKLMFFYTRYPSSHVLKMCFSDVQFTRCITSQLIKWFSNFREFFYIQMEKSVRQVVLQGEPDGDTLTVGRESQLFRVLNMHFNKTTHFQVPDRFLEVAEITLREFYAAICLGRDRDPSWKKAIYRVISKLDSDVPAQFMLA